MNDSTEEVITEDGPDRRRRLCRCSECEVVKRCTPTSDFYTVDGRSGLLCESCFFVVTDPRRQKGLPNG